MLFAALYLASFGSSSRISGLALLIDQSGTHDGRLCLLSPSLYAAQIVLRLREIAPVF
jgi:hypothetical protein